MRFSLLSLSFVALSVTSANAQYFSAGWTPGQPVPKAEEPSVNPLSTPQKPPGKVSEKLVSSVLNSGPSNFIFSQFGINITQLLSGALQSNNKIWDERVPLITDDNFQEIIVNEPLTQQEEQDRTWIIVISVTSGRQDGISLVVDEIFDTAYNETIIAGDLPNVRWGRIDYLAVTAITTKWAVWHAPYLVVLKDRGRTLRFYKPHHLRLKASFMREFLIKEEWKSTPPWSSVYAPGGDREYIMDYFSFALTKVYNASILIPRWLLLIVSGSLASVIINFLHKPNAPAAEQAAPQQQLPKTSSAKAETAPAAVESSATPSPSKATKRKRVKGAK